MSRQSQSRCMLVLASFFSLSARTAARTHQTDSSADVVAVGRVLSGIVAADNAGDLDGVMAFYAEDAILLPPNGTAVNGKALIRSRYEEGFRHFRFDIAFSSDETQVFGDWAFIRGAIRGRTIPKDAQPSRILNDKYIMVLHRGKDGWRIARLIWNGSDSLPKASS